MLGISTAAESIGFRTIGVHISFDQLAEAPLPSSRCSTTLYPPNLLLPSYWIFPRLRSSAMQRSMVRTLVSEGNCSAMKRALQPGLHSTIPKMDESRDSSSERAPSAGPLSGSVPVSGCVSEGVSGERELSFVPVTTWGQSGLSVSVETFCKRPA